MEKKILIIEDGILFEGEEKNLNEEKWSYKVRDQEGKFIIIDKDKSKAQPMVKSILNEMDLFPELKILKIIQMMLMVLIVIVIIGVIYEFSRLPTVKDIKELKDKINSVSEKNSKNLDPKEQIKRILSNTPEKIGQIEQP